MHNPLALSALAMIALASACEAHPDSVAPGYYGEMQGSAATPARSNGAAGANDRSASPRPSNGSSTPGSMMAQPSAGAPTTPSASKPPRVHNGGGAAGIDGAGSGADPAQPAPDNMDCNLSGRWLVTYHLVADALGELQYIHNYLYHEIDQQGDSFTVTRGILCEQNSVGLGDFAATSSFSGARVPIAERTIYSGRSGTSVSAADGCKVDFDEWYTVIGATNPYYLDPSVPLPTAEQMASGDAPGWEDWDGDGNPGITGNVSGVVTGKIFAAPRLRTAFGGVVDLSSAFVMTTQWLTEQNVMAYDGTPLLASESVRAADASLHFTQMARLAPDQASGDVEAICDSIIELAPVLTPEAAGN